MRYSFNNWTVNHMQRWESDTLQNPMQQSRLRTPCFNPYRLHEQKITCLSLLVAVISHGNCIKSYSFPSAEASTWPFNCMQVTNHTGYGGWKLTEATLLSKMRRDQMLTPFVSFRMISVHSNTARKHKIVLRSLLVEVHSDLPERPGVLVTSEHHQFSTLCF